MQGKREEFFCDDESRLKMMRRMFLGRYTPLFIILVLLILPNLFLQLHSKEPDAPVLVVLFLILLAAYGWVFASFVRQYWKLKRRSGESALGPPGEKPNHPPLVFQRRLSSFRAVTWGCRRGGRGASSKHANPRKNLGLTAFT